MKKRNSIRKIGLVLLHSLGFILLFFVIRKLDFQMLKENIALFKIWKIFAGLGILMIVYLIKTYRWLIINRAFGLKGSFGTLLVFFLFSGLLSSITPGRLGEFSRIWFIQKKYKAGITVSTSSVLLDRIWDVLVLSMIGGISVIMVISRFAIEWYTLAIIIIIFLVALGIILFPGILFKPALALAGKRPVREELNQIYSAWKKNRIIFLILGFSTSLLAFGILALIPLMLSADLDAPVRYGTSVTAVSISNILSFLPVTVAGFGTREFVFTRVWSVQSYSAVTAVSVSTMFFVCTYLGSMVFGGIAYLLRIRKFYSIREIRSRK
ncbi:lysylphosphatidylglycerol synthase transmembrane domain-containing protein [Bacteroidota bacterium]